MNFVRGAFFGHIADRNIDGNIGGNIDELFMEILKWILIGIFIEIFMKILMNYLWKYWRVYWWEYLSKFLWKYWWEYWWTIYGNIDVNIDGNIHHAFHKFEPNMKWLYLYNKWNEYALFKYILHYVTFQNNVILDDWFKFGNDYIIMTKLESHFSYGGNKRKKVEKYILESKTICKLY